MPSPVNPYIAGNPVGAGPAFVGRGDVINAVRRFLGDPQHHGVVLFGQRRVGKTSILQQLEARLPENGGPRAIYFDLQDKAAWPVARILADIAAAVAAALGLPKPVPGAEPEAWFRDTWLPPVLDALPQGRPLVILFDEFDVLTDPTSQREVSEAFFESLRDLLARTAPRLRFVFVIGRNMEDLSYRTVPLFKTMPSKQVSMLLPAEVESLVRLSEKSGSLAWAKEAVDVAWALTHGHPYLLQHLCWHVWEEAHERDGAPAPVGGADVEAAVPATLDASHNPLEWLWGGLPPAARVVASALAKAGSGAISEEALSAVLRESGVRVLIRELRDAPKRLEAWDILEPEGDGHRFRVELLRRWIQRYKPLARVQQELDYIEPLAESLFKAGEGYYRAGKPDDALAQLRQALVSNPNHLRASELLAEILISKGELDAAREALERLHENYPAEARPRLVEVLLAKVVEKKAGVGGSKSLRAKIGAPDGAEQPLDIYGQVLKLDPRNATALEGKKSILQARAARLVDDGQLEEAERAYRDAGLEENAARVGEMLRTKRLEALLARAQGLESTGQYTEALEVISTGARDFADRDWTVDTDRLQRASEMEGNYQRATGALVSGDRETAKVFLAKVVATKPEYKEAAKLLYETVSGANDPAKAPAPAAAKRESRSTRWTGGVVPAALAVGVLLLGWEGGAWWVARGTGVPAGSAGAPSSAAPTASASVTASASASAVVPVAVVPTTVAPTATASATTVPCDADALKKETESLLNRGKRPEAIQKAREAITCDPRDAMPYVNLGSALQDSGKWKDGLAAYSECVRNATKGPVNECRAMGGHK